MKKELKKERNRWWITRAFLWLVAPLFFNPFKLFQNLLAAITPARVTPAEATAFEKLTPGQRWNKIKKADWTLEKLAKERYWSCVYTYLALTCSVMVFTGTILAWKYLNWFQLTGTLAYGLAAFFVFARKSMWVYALDNKQVILFDIWFRNPIVWLPPFTSTN